MPPSTSTTCAGWPSAACRRSPTISSRAAWRARLELPATTTPSSEYRLVPRYCVDVTTRDQSTTIFGKTYSGPVGIAPTGLIGLFRRGGDMMLAEAAKAANVPFIMSGTGTGLIEDLGRIAPDHGWYQLYVAKDRKHLRGHGAPRPRCRPLHARHHPRRARQLQARAQHPQRVRASAEAHAQDQDGGLPASGLDGRVPAPRHAPVRQLAALCARRRVRAQVAEFVASQMPTPVLWQDIESFRRAVAGQAGAQGHHASRRRHPRRGHGRRRHHGVEPRRRASSTGRRRRSRCCPPSMPPSATR